MQASSRPLTLSLASRVELHPLQIHQEPGRDPLVGSADSGRYLEVEPAVLEAIQAIQASASLEEAEARLAGPEGERPDLVELAQALHRAGLVSRVDGGEVPRLDSFTSRHAFLRRLPPAKARRIRHPAVLALCATILLLSLEVFLLEPRLVPSYRDLRLFQRPSLALASIMGGTLAMAYLHELAHFFVARSYGIEARITVSNRYYMVVLQTDVTQAHTLGRWEKTAIFCAGIAFNLTMMGVGALLGFAIHAGWVDASPFQEAAVRYFMAINLLPLLFQLFVFARTDLYHVLAAWTGHRNLLQDSRRFLALQGERLVSAFLSRPRIPCVPCGRPRFGFEPYCVHCGTPQRVQDPNRYPFRRRDRWAFSLFGIVATVGPLVFFLPMGRYILRLFYELTFVSATLGQSALQEGNLVVGAESALVLVLLGMQAFFLLKFLFSILSSMLRGLGWGLRLYYERRHPFLHPMVRPLFEGAIALKRSWESAVLPAWERHVGPRLPLLLQRPRPPAPQAAQIPSIPTETR